MLLLMLRKENNVSQKETLSLKVFLSTYLFKVKTTTMSKIEDMLEEKQTITRNKKNYQRQRF